MTVPTNDSAGDRVSRRREQNRRAIITAAQELIAELGLDITAKEVADRADLALKTLYNHFPTKNDVVHAAVFEAAGEFEAYLKARTSGIEDVILRATTRMRLNGRMIDTHPIIARVLVNASSIASTMGTAITDEASALITELSSENELTSANHRMLLMVALASNSRLTAMRLADPTIGPESADELAIWLITAFGYPEKKVRALVAEPLPAWPVRS